MPVKHQIYLIAILFLAMPGALNARDLRADNVPHFGINGIVTAVEDRSFNIEYKDKHFKIMVDANTKYFVNGEPARAAAVRVGARVRIAGSAAGMDQVNAISINVIGHSAGSSRSKKDRE